MRYEDPNELIDYHVDALFALKAIRRESANELRQLIDDFNNHIRSLQSLELQIDNWDPMLIRVFVEKLDARTKEKWEKRVSELGEKPFRVCKPFWSSDTNFSLKLADRARPPHRRLINSARQDRTDPPSRCILMRAGAHSALRIIYYHSARALRALRLTVASRRCKSYASVLIAFSRDTPPRPAHAARAARAAQDITQCYTPSQASHHGPTERRKKPRPLQPIVPIQILLRTCPAWLLERFHRSMCFYLPR